MKYPLPKLASKLAPYRDVIVFAVTLQIANFLWKWTVIGENSSTQVLWFGLDITAPFVMVSNHVAQVVYQIVHLFRDTVHLEGTHIIRFDSGSATSVVWSCSAIKQAWIWLALMLTSRGPWLRKLWFIPLGWLGIHVFNVLRISAISMLIEFHPEWFPILHEYIFKYLFYGMMFLMWVLWIDRIASGGKIPAGEGKS